MAKALSTAQILEYLKELEIQERDARLGLTKPEFKPGLHRKLHQLIARISKERAGLVRAISTRYDA